MLMDTDFKDSLINAQSVEEFMDLINQKEAAQKAKEEEKEEAQKEFTGTYRLLAVTACPTGIAHTYMSAEALEEKVKQMGITIIVETDGSGGTKNAPTAKEIEECEAIIVAADKNVEMARFDGKPVIQVKVADGINKAEELINEALSGNAPIYHADHVSTTVENDESVGRQIYKHLMNGVSHMLPFVIGGGILIALAFLFDDYTIDPSNFGKNTPLAAFFKTTGDTAFGFMLPILAGYISMSISDRPGLAVGFVGGALASQGNSGFLGALVAGFAAGYLMKGLRKLFDYLPDAFEGLKFGYTGYFHKAVLQQNFHAVSGKAMMVRRTSFLQAGGFSEEVEDRYKDVDLCLKVRKNGSLIVYDPYVQLYHMESKTRGAEDSEAKVRRFQEEIEYMRCQWIDILRKGDPYYNKNLSLTKWNYSLRPIRGMENKEK